MAAQVIDQQLAEPSCQKLTSIANKVNYDIALDYEEDVDEENYVPSELIKCSAVHTLERDMPDCDYSHLVKELRIRILTYCETNQGYYLPEDKEKCRTDDWFLSRFLLRQKLDTDAAFEMIKNAMKFKINSIACHIKNEDFPSEFYKIGGLFNYEPDRKGNLMLYVRVKVHRKIPEIKEILQAFLYHIIQLLDELAHGKGN